MVSAIKGPTRTRTRQPELVQETVGTGDAEEVTVNVATEGEGGITQAKGQGGPSERRVQRLGHRLPF